METTQILLIAGAIGLAVLAIIAIRGSFKDDDAFYGDSTTVTRLLEPGEHTIEAVIANADHSLTDARTSITVNVTGSAAGGTGTATTTPSLYGY